MSSTVELDRLSRWLDEQGLPGAGEPLSVGSIAGGASNEILELRRGEHHMVLRRPPANAPEGRNETMLREYRVLSALAGTDVPHARVMGACDDPDVLGAWFYVMDYVDGWSPIGEGGWPPPFGTDAGARREMAFQLVDGIARLSKVDWRSRGLEGFGRPDGFHERQVDRWLSHLAACKFRDIPGVDTTAEWLRNHKPSVYEPGIMHGDYQFANVMYRHDTPAHLTAIVDWEMATIGDPLLDLAWVVNGWPGPGDAPAVSGYVDYSGMPGRDELLEYYARESGRSVDEIDYYCVLAGFKLGIVLEAGYARWVKGEADNEKMQSFGPIVLDLMRRAADLASSSKL